MNDLNQKKSSPKILLDSSSLNAIQLMEIAKRWHSRIQDELSNPILPEELNPEALEEKTKSISRQREKHKLYSRALEKLIRITQRSKERQT